MNELRNKIDEKGDLIKDELMTRVEEKIDQAFSELDDNTDRSDQLDDFRVLKSELEDMIQNQTQIFDIKFDKLKISGMVI